MILYDFRSLAPDHALEQAATLRWLAQAHARAEALRPGFHEREGSVGEFAARMGGLLRRYGCGPDRIRTRRVAVADFTHTDFDAMALYSLRADPSGPTMSERSAHFGRAATQACERLYPDDREPPAHLIHVTCTGYRSPSCAQELVTRRGWHAQTTVTHAYHMGCYAALPAIRVARGLLAASPGPETGRSDRSGRVDILHTEICSLHLQPADHSPEQLVVQSLFADGFIRYSATHDKTQQTASGGAPGLEVVAIHEELIPGTESAMSWECSETGMRMGLSRDVPDLIVGALDGFVARLCAQGGVAFAEIRPDAVFAVHPGGPKIVDCVRDRFSLTETQIRDSREVLATCGNMSSATLPHVWAALLGRSDTRIGTWVVNLAFGPGLCISGSLFRVVPC